MSASTDQVKILFLSSLHEATGNNTTCKRIQDFITAQWPQYVVHAIDVAALDTASALGMQQRERYACAIGVHAYRAGRFLISMNVCGFVIVLVSHSSITLSDSVLHRAWRD